MRYNWLSFFGAILIWALKGFEGKLTDIEEKYTYSALVIIIPLVLFIVLIYLIENNYLDPFI